MGYELDKVMGLYGVKSPSTVYGGVAPVAPTAPVYTAPAAGSAFSGRFFGSPATPASTAPSYEQQVDAYNALLAKYNEQMPQYLAEKAAFERDLAARQSINPTDIYNQTQFGRGDQAGKTAATTPAGTLIVPAYTPLAPLAYMGSTLGTNAAGQRTSIQDAGGEGTATGGNDSPGPGGVSTVGSGQSIGSTIGNALGVTSPAQGAMNGFSIGGIPGAVIGGLIGMAVQSDPTNPSSVNAVNGLDAQSDAATAAAAAAAADAANAATADADAAADSGIGGDADGGSTSGASDGPGGDYARGGVVRRRFAEGGLNDLTDKYAVSAGPEMNAPAVSADPAAGFEMPQATPQMTGTTPAMSGGFGEVAPAAPVATPGMPGMPAGLEQMLARYQGGADSSMYGEELKAARKAATAESDKFAKMLEGAMAQTGESAPSKAEMYFRLAAAFGAPTRTGSFGESLGAAGKAMGEYGKETREAEKAARTNKLQLALKGQELRMSGAKEDLSTLRTLAGEEMKDKRAVATKLLEQYIKSGEPESAAGKQAKDEGLRPGSAEFQARVAKIAENNVDKQMAQINATLANVSVAQANQALAQQKFGFQQEQAAKLSPAEVKLKTETEDMIAQTDQALANLKKAYSLNPNTFDASLVDVAQRKALEAAGSKDPKVQNTREMENMLEKAALSSLKSTFPGAISNDERKALQDVQGLGAKSKEERAKIMKNGYAALKTISERSRKRLNEITSGVYRNASSIDEGEK